MPFTTQPLGNYLFWAGGYGNGDPGADPGNFNSVNTVCVSPDGSVYTAEDTPNRSQKFSARTLVYQSLLSGGGNQPQDPFDISYNVFDGNLYIADHGGTKVSVWQTNYTFVRKWGVLNAAPTGGQIAELEDCIVDGVGNVVVSDIGADRVNVYDTLGNYSRTIPSFHYFFPKTASLTFDGTKIVRADDGIVYDTTTGSSVATLLNENGTSLGIQNTNYIPYGNKAANLWVFGAGITPKIYKYETTNFNLIGLYSVDMGNQISPIGFPLSSSASPAWAVNQSETIIYLCNWDTPYIYSFSLSGNRGGLQMTPRGRGASW